jgi:hypothetical protein
VIVQEEELPTTFNFADALKQSLENVGRPPSEEAKPAKAAAGAKKPPARSEPAVAAKKQKVRKQA